MDSPARTRNFTTVAFSLSFPGFAVTDSARKCTASRWRAALLMPPPITAETVVIADRARYNIIPLEDPRFTHESAGNRKYTIASGQRQEASRRSWLSD